MYIDVIMPRGNEKEFLRIGVLLGYKKLFFCYEKSNKQEGLDLTNNEIGVKIGTIVSNSQNNKPGFFIYKVNNQIRTVIERGAINLIYSQEELEKKDKQHFRLSGLNNIVCKILKEKDIIVGFSFNSILKTIGRKRAVILGRMQQNLILCRKYNVKMFIGSFTTNPYEMRSPRDLMTFGVLLGMHPNEAMCGLELEYQE